MLSCAAKIAERMVLNRLRWKLGDPHRNIYGFCRGKSTALSVASLLSLINDRKAVVVFLDLEKAFELASPTAIAATLAARGVRGKLLAWARDYLEARSASVRFQGHVSTAHNFENGTPQGGVLSPTLFNVLMECLVALPLHRNVTLISYADDLALVSSGAGDILARAQTALDAVTHACADLGLKVSAEKSMAMAVHCTPPERNLRIQGVQLQWTNAYLYLGIWIDSKLTFKKEVAYLKDRTKTRLNVMRAMTSTRAGATHRVLRIYYVQAVRSLVDYAAVVLVALAKSRKKDLEVIQNHAMRIITGAARWCRIAALQNETQLPPLALRVEQLTATLVARTVGQGTDTPARNALIPYLRQDPDLFRGKSWLRIVVQATRAVLPDIDLVDRGADRVEEDYDSPPPWAPPPAVFVFTPLPTKKSQCPRNVLLAEALATIDRVGKHNTLVYFTDGSVDPETGRTGAAIVTGEEVFSWRTSDGCSTIQTELVAIAAALDHAQRQPGQDITIFSDSLTALQALRDREPKDNVRLITHTQSRLKSLADDGRTVTLAWIPSHVGVPGNERADEGAKSALTHDRIHMPVLKSLQQIKLLARRTVSQRANESHRAAEGNSRTLTWYAKATGYEPLGHAPLTRQQRVDIQRLRLGYLTPREATERGEYEGEVCPHCEEDSAEPLLHFLLDCEATEPLRVLAARRGFTFGGNRTHAAARMVRYLTDDLMTLSEFLQTYRPPR